MLLLQDYSKWELNGWHVQWADRSMSLLNDYDSITLRNIYMGTYNVCGTAIQW